MARRRYSEADFRDAVADPAVRSIADLCRHLGLVPRGANYDTVQRYAEELGLDLSRFLTPGRRARAITDEAIVTAVTGARSIAEALRRLNLPTDSHRYGWLRRRAEDAGIDLASLPGKGWARNQKRPDRATDVAAYLVRGSRIPSDALRRKLIVQGIKPHQCEHCGRTEWFGRPIPLELDHIDGDRTNNLLANLRLLCPNCHALTPTYRGRNIGKARGRAGTRYTGTA